MQQKFPSFAPKGPCNIQDVKLGDVLTTSRIVKGETDAQPHLFALRN